MKKQFLFAAFCISSCITSAQWTQKADKAGLCGTQSLNAVVEGNFCYIGAGYSGSCPDWYKYDPLNDSWTILPPFPTSYITQSTGFAINGKIYVGIGSDNSGSCNNELYEYTPATGSWAYKSTMPGPKRHNCVSFVINNKAYIGLGTDSTGSTGYTDFYEYTPGNNTWTPIASFPGQGTRGSTAFTVSGKGYVVGGRRVADNQTAAAAFRYDPSNNQWQQITKVPDSKNFAASAAVFSNTAYLCMGLGTQPGSAGRKDLYRYNEAGDSWTLIDSIPDNRTWDEGIGFSVNGKLYFGLGDDIIMGLVNPMMWQYTPPATSVTQVEASEEIVALVPNPSKGQFLIRKNTKAGFRSVTISSVTGKQLRVWYNVAADQILDCSVLPPGIYLLTALDEKNQRATGKLVLQ